MFMEIVLILLGLIVGFFVWSTIVGVLFATIPINLKAKHLGVIESVRWLPIMLGFFVNAIIIVAMFVYIPVTFYASLLGLFRMLLLIPTLRHEAINNLRRDYEITETFKEDALDIETANESNNHERNN